MKFKTFNRSAMLDQKISLKALSFFSGCMGLDLGLEQEGIEILLACENDPDAQKTIKFNRPDIELIEDINQYSAAEIRKKAGLSPTEEIDLIVGSPPCQGFSIPGTKQESNVQDNLLPTFIDLIAELRPKFVVIETCPGLLHPLLRDVSNSMEKVSHPNLGHDKQISVIFSYIIRRLKGAGYSVSFDLYNAADFGSPQVRKRVIITCSRDGKELPYLTPTHAKNGVNELPKWQTLRDAIEGVYSDELHFNKIPKTLLKYYRLLKPGQNWQNLPADLLREVLQKKYRTNTNFLRRLAWNEPSPALLTKGRLPNGLVHPEADRTLSIEEYKRIQDLPDDWQIKGSSAFQYLQVGNATPCSLGRAIAKMLLTYVYGEPLSDSAYKEEIEKRFNSFKTIEEWRKETASANFYNKKEIYIQVAISSYLKITGLSNEMEVTCGKYESDRLDIIIRSENTVIEVKKIIDKKSLREGVSQLNTYAIHTGMTRKILIGLPDLRERKKVEIKELIKEHISNNLNLEIYTLDLAQECLGLNNVFHREKHSEFVRNKLKWLDIILGKLGVIIREGIINSSNKIKDIAIVLLTESEKIPNLLGAPQATPSYEA